MCMDIESVYDFATDEFILTGAGNYLIQNINYDGKLSILALPKNQKSLALWLII